MRISAWLLLTDAVERGVVGLYECDDCCLCGCNRVNG